MFLQLSSSFTPLKMQDPELVKQLKEMLPEALFEKLNGSLSIDRDRLRFAEYKVRVLEERLRLVRIEKYGPGSEKLSDAQLELFEWAPAPVRIIEKGLASDRVVIDTVVSKYADHVPLYRQSAILERETGIDLSRATLDGWVMRVGELLRPITAAMGQELLSGSYIQADETTVGVQMHDGRGKNHQAYLWQYSRPRRPVVFEFRMGLDREAPKRFLGSFEGLLQSDGYGAYDHIGRPKLVHVACWAHAR